MSEFKCACGNKKCPITLAIFGKELFFTDQYEKTTLMYLSKESKKKMLKALRIFEDEYGDKTITKEGIKAAKEFYENQLNSG